VLGQDRRELPVATRSDPGELAEIPIEVRLVGVTGAQRHVDPRGGPARRDEGEGALEAEHAAVALRREPDGAAEELEEAPVAVAAPLHQRAKVGASLELLQGRGHGRVRAPRLRQARAEQRFEEIELTRGGACPREALARFLGRCTPEILERRVSLGQLAGGDAEEETRSARTEHRPHGAHGPRDVSQIGARARAADDSGSDQATLAILAPVVHAQGSSGESEDEMRIARRQDALALAARRVRIGRAVRGPERPYEEPQRRRRGAREQHRGPA
jgi:hypothetical protein